MKSRLTANPANPGKPSLNLREALRQLLREYAKDTGCSESDAIRDVLTDLQHLCDEQGLDFIERTTASTAVYCDELLENLR